MSQPEDILTQPSSVSDMGLRNITYDHYAEFRHRQDDLIAREFRNQRNHADKKFEMIDVKFGMVDRRFDEIDYKFELVDQKFAKVDDQFVQVNQRLDKLDSKVGNLEVRFDKLEGKVDKLEGRFDHLDSAFRRSEALRNNKNAYMPRHPLEPITRLNSSGPQSPPKFYPKTILQFWNLKSNHSIKKLALLVKFYDIQGFRYWGLGDYDVVDSDEDSDSEVEVDESEHDEQLRAAVMKYPLVALEKLAAALGVKFDKVRSNMEHFDALRQAKELMLPPKRKQSSSGSNASKSPKRSRPDIPRLPAPGRLPDSELFAKSPSSTKSVPQAPSAILGYEAHSDVFEQKRAKFFEAYGVQPTSSANLNPVERQSSGSSSSSSSAAPENKAASSPHAQAPPSSQLPPRPSQFPPASQRSTSRRSPSRRSSSQRSLELRSKSSSGGDSESDMLDTNGPPPSVVYEEPTQILSHPVGHYLANRSSPSLSDRFD